jgi:hypothetical protein
MKSPLPLFFKEGQRHFRFYQASPANCSEFGSNAKPETTLLPVQSLHEPFLFDFVNDAHVDKFGRVPLGGVDGC